MTSSATETAVALAVRVELTAERLAVDLTDGRTIAVPTAWFPRLVHATDAERAQWRLIGAGRGIHWPAVDEDIAIEDLLAGRPSGECQESLRKWLAGREDD